MADVFFTVVLSFLAVFLILLVLVQRGRGGGLAGALGGMGGSSAFGAKAGDVFTRITIVTASIWIVICLVAVFWAKHGGDAFSGSNPTAMPARTEPLDSPVPGATTGAANTQAPAATTQVESQTPAADGGAAESAESAPATTDSENATLPPAENQ